MSNPPQNIRSLSDEGCLELTWSPGRVTTLGFRFLRENCPCAACVDEFTGERILDVSKVPDDIHPTAIGISGNYALKIGWSDGHHTGLFTWDYLDELSTRWEQNHS